MNQRCVVGVVLGLVALGGPVVAEEPCASLDALSWLEGEWATDEGPRMFRERWTRVTPDTVEGEGTGESLRLVAMSGGVFYLAKVPHNELPVAFKAVSCGDGYAVFENMAHDFPKRLVYRLADGRLRVRVSDGAEWGFDLDFARR